MRKFYFCLLVLGLQVLLVLPGFSQKFLPQGNAVTLSKRCYRVTENLEQQQGAIWWDSKIDLTKPIELDFIFYMGDKDAGADGMAFIFQNDPRGFNAAGDAGGGLYFGDIGGGGITPSVAIEFDTWQNWCNDSDPAFDHTTVVYNGNVCEPKFPPVQINPNNPDVEDNTCHNYKITWNPATQELKMFFEGNLRFTHKDDLIKNVFDGATQVYYGFAGSTGGAVNEQSVCVLQGNTVPVGRDDQASLAIDTQVVTNVLANDTDDDGDDLYVTKITKFPTNGTATIQNAATITYTPNPSFKGDDALEYQVCDVNGENCYVNCSVATVRYKVGCLDFNLKTQKVKDNGKCDDALPNNGVARAYVLEGNTQVTAGYTFRWYNGTDTTVTPTYVGALQSAMTEGNYLVVGINNLSGCRSTLGNVSIARVTPSISPDDILLVQEAAVTSCKAPGGSLSASVKNQTSGYSFTWYLDAADRDDPTKIIGIGPRISGLQARSYTVLVRDLATGCIGLNAIGVASTTVQPVVQSSITHFTSCANPNGSVSVNVEGSTTGYAFEWYKGATVRNGPADFVGPVYGSLAPGRYTVRATNTLTSCQSSPVTYEVLDRTPALTVNISFSSNFTSCQGTEGSLQASVPTPNAQGYLYQWYTGQLPVDASRRIPNATGTALANLQPGIYTLEVTNQDNGCKAYRTIPLTLTSLPDVRLDQNSSTSCSGPDGSLTATLRNAADFPAGSITYEWYQGNNVSAQKLIPGATGALLSGLSPGNYTVVAVTTDGCRSIPVTATVLNAAVKPVVDISIRRKTDCTGKNGVLEVVDSVSRSPLSNATFAFDWYSGKEAVASSRLNAPSNPMPGLATGDYTVIVTNTGSGCSDTASVFLPPAVLFPIQLVATAVPVSSCINANGRVEAKVTNDDGPYTFNWYNDQNQLVPGTGAVRENLSAGTYRVEVFANGQICPNVVAPVVTVADVIKPSVTIAEDAPMRNCDPNRGNGQLSASVDGDLSKYRFEWFKGTNPVGATIFNNTPIATRLTADTYSVRLTDLATGCDIIRNYAVSMQPRPVKAPTPEIRNHMTSCSNPNGTVTASVEGNTSRYVFNWYKGDRVQGTPFFTGPQVSNLDRGVFSVTATDKETACVSEKATFTILDGRKYPDFTFRVINSSCSDNTGVIEVIVNKAFNLDQISWSRGATSPNATNVSQQPTGEYEVTLTTKEGCSTTKKATIGVAVQAYNGVSANNDGLNDHFIIDCIETFPGNNVKILNRAGALVFEGDSYDNVQVKFEGTGNRGIYVTGNQLPAGTYFYIIDKKDGSKTLSGYLELVR